MISYWNEFFFESEESQPFRLDRSYCTSSIFSLWRSMFRCFYRQFFFKWTPSEQRSLAVHIFWRGGVKGWNISFEHWLDPSDPFVAIARVQTSKKRGNDASEKFGLDLFFPPRLCLLFIRSRHLGENNRHNNARSRATPDETKTFIPLISFCRGFFSPRLSKRFLKPAFQLI